MQLTGTLEEKIYTLIEFGKAHRSIVYDSAYEKHVEELYRNTGVKFTDAARKFWREYAGVMDTMMLYPDRANIVTDDGRKYIAGIDFDFHCVDEEALAWSIPESEPDDFYPDFAKIIREKYGEDTVLVAEGGYYYPCLIWVRPDDSLISIMPDAGIEKYYNTLEEFICYHLKDKFLSRVEVVTETMKLSGTLEERLHSAIDFAKNHGGFEHCSILEGKWGRVQFDLSKVLEYSGHSDAEIFHVLCQAISEHVLMQSANSWGAYLPGKIQAVEK